MISKFETQEEKERKEQRTKKIMSYFIVSVLFISVAAYGLMSFGDNNSQGESYGKFNFVELADGWQAKINDFFIITLYHPKEVEDIEYNGFIEKEGFENIVYFVAKTEAEKQAAEEMKTNIVALKKDFACLPEYLNSEECLNLTAKTCSDASYIQKIVIFDERQANASISYANNCLIISGENKEDITRAADKALFIILGIIK